MEKQGNGERGDGRRERRGRSKVDVAARSHSSSCSTLITRCCDGISREHGDQLEERLRRAGGVEEEDGKVSSSMSMEGARRTRSRSYLSRS